MGSNDLLGKHCSLLSCSLTCRSGRSRPAETGRHLNSLWHEGGLSSYDRSGAAAGRDYLCAGPVLSRSLRHPLLSPIRCLVTDPHFGSDMQSWLPTAVGMIAGCCSTAAF